MAIEYPTYQEVINRVRADILNNLPEVDPSIFGSFIRAIGDGIGGRGFDFIILLQQLEDQQFPQTSTGTILDKWASYENLERFAPTLANGEDNISITGTATTVIPVDTAFTSLDGNTYELQSEATISQNVISVTSLTRVSTLVAATTASDHGLATSNSVIISGANESDYNGTFSIIVTGTDTFQYTITGTPTTPATGTILSTYTNVVGTVKSTETGLDKNMDSGAKLTLVTPQSGVDNDNFVTYNAITEGTDEETDARLLIRIMQSRANPVANFNVGAIEKQAFLIAGVTRVLVKRITPSVGYVTIYFVRDDDDTIIPSSAEVTEVEDSILEILPAQSAEANVIVLAPTPVTTNYTFSVISPDTTTMRTAVETNLAAFYRDVVTFETDVTEIEYNSAIIDTVDPTNGDKLQSFTLTVPSGDISISLGELNILGEISF